MLDTLAWAIVAVLLVVLVIGAVYLVRMRRLLNEPGSIQVAIRHGGGWRNGVVILSEHSLDVYYTRSLKWSPSLQTSRDHIAFELKPARAGVQIVVLNIPGDRWQLASSPGEISALLSWIDSAAPEAEPTLG
ncbi:DUF2550 family protein [Trueperella bialowiezensis]|uniref:Protein of uncharacterized function (DUF2550) n=1 Tax=Trueperella bialowiezensis TaxID=312285 RepID=A0A448PFP3_9ACTO|nr:DUF2550 family protein [Trueperella bialowiezensis]VEI13769.1 Protein of uncharacterised function (DUF2550) [Trueperella bialowiezensis]